MLGAQALVQVLVTAQPRFQGDLSRWMTSDVPESRLKHNGKWKGKRASIQGRGSLSHSPRTFYPHLCPRHQNQDNLPRHRWLRLHWSQALGEYWHDSQAPLRVQASRKKHRCTRKHVYLYIHVYKLSIYMCIFNVIRFSAKHSTQIHASAST